METLIQESFVWMMKIRLCWGDPTDVSARLIARSIPRFVVAVHQSPVILFSKSNKMFSSILSSRFFCFDNVIKNKIGVTYPTFRLEQKHCPHLPGFVVAVLQRAHPFRWADDVPGSVFRGVFPLFNLFLSSSQRFRELGVIHQCLQRGRWVIVAPTVSWVATTAVSPF